MHTDGMSCYALQLGVAEDSPYADIRVVDNVDLQIHGSSECMSRRTDLLTVYVTCLGKRYVQPTTNKYGA